MNNENQASPQKKRNWRTGCAWCGGCGCLVFLFVFSIPIPIIPYLYTASRLPMLREHLPKSDFLTDQGTNYSFYRTLTLRVGEFDISEEKFFQMCENNPTCKIVPIETLPNLPENSLDNRINPHRKIPLMIMRYNCEKPEHRNCTELDVYRECKIDPTGKTDASCCRSVSKGYYFYNSNSTGKCLFFLYDNENGRCYYRYYPH